MYTRVAKNNLIRNAKQKYFKEVNHHHLHHISKILELHPKIKNIHKIMLQIQD